MHCYKLFPTEYKKKRHEEICLRLQAKRRLHCMMCGQGFQSVQKRRIHEAKCMNFGGNEDIELIKYVCGGCQQTFSCKQNLDKHDCKVNEEYRCEYCLKVFERVLSLNRHRKQCKKRHENVVKQVKRKRKYEDTGDPAELVGSRGPALSQDVVPPLPADPPPPPPPLPPGPPPVTPPSSPPSSPVEKRFHCRLCYEIFENRRRLHQHQNMQHGGALQERPWRAEAHLDEPPWGEPVRDDALRQIYEGNQNIILADAKINRGRKDVYNLPTNNLRDGIGELWDKLDDIFVDQNQSFKVNMSLGIILRNIDNGEYRYFAPQTNETLFPSPFLIGSRKYLRIFKNKLRRLDPLEYANNLRPNSKWRPSMITNVRFDVTPTDFPLGQGYLPDYVKQKRSIMGMEKNNRGEDVNNCFFQCLAYHRNQWLEKYVETLENEWKMYSGKKKVELSDLSHLEECFKVNVNVYELQSNETVKPVYISSGVYEDDVYLNVYKNHLSYVKDFKKYAKKFTCVFCQKMFKRVFDWRRHMKQCKGKTKWEYPGTFYSPKMSMFEGLQQSGVLVEETFFPWFIVYDFEAILQREVSQVSENLKWEARHIPISVSVCSNVEGYTEPRCFVEANVRELLRQMLDYMSEIGRKIGELAYERWGYILEHVQSEEKKKLEAYLQEVPVLGFNSAKYDINLMKTEMVQLLHLDEKDDYFVVKKNNSYMCLSDKSFRFLDISNFLAPGCSYSKFLKAFEIEESKFYFPYEWFDDKSKLEWTCVPEVGDFYSSLKRQNTLGDTEEEIQANYKRVQEVWEKEDMKTFKDYLVYYNNLDVGPFVKAVEKMHVFYKENNIDYLKEAISVPGIARKMMFQNAEEGLFLLCGKNDQDLYKTMKKNVIGGASIIFCRHHKVDETRIRGNKMCKNIIGYDCNALYLWALAQPMPTGCFVRRFYPDFKPQVSHKYLDMYVWMDYVADLDNIRIQHKLNSGKEKKIGPYLCDGFDEENNVVYEMDGCFYHGHKCYLTENSWKSHSGLMYARQKKTKEKEDYLKHHGYRVEKIKECEYKKYIKPHMNYDKYLPAYYRQHKRSLSEAKILKDVEQGHVYGMVEVDIEVPAELYDHFSEMSPLFCTCFIPVDVMGEYTQQQIKELDLGKHPRKLLVGGMKAKRLLLLTPLLRWYLNHGLVVTHVYQLIEFSPKSCFKQFKQFK